LNLPQPLPSQPLLPILLPTNQAPSRVIPIQEHSLTSLAMEALATTLAATRICMKRTTMLANTPLEPMIPTQITEAD